MIGACLAVGGLLAVPVGNATESASRIIDHTAVCQMPGEGFPDSTRFMTVAVARRHERTGSPPFISVMNGPSFELRAQIRTRAGGRKTTGSVAFSRTHCAPASLRVRFSTRGLRDRSPKPFGRSYQCKIPTELVVPIRATFRRPTGFSGDALNPSVVRARGQITTGYLMVTAVQNRKPLAFASVNDTTGDARLFVARTACAPHR
jgi:hypothetical protein